MLCASPLSNEEHMAICRAGILITEHRRLRAYKHHGSGQGQNSSKVDNVYFEHTFYIVTYFIVFVDSKLPYLNEIKPSIYHPTIASERK